LFARAELFVLHVGQRPSERYSIIDGLAVQRTPHAYNRKRLHDSQRQQFEPWLISSSGSTGTEPVHEPGVRPPELGYGRRSDGFETGPSQILGPRFDGLFVRVPWLVWCELSDQHRQQEPGDHAGIIPVLGDPCFVRVGRVVRVL
jgi:hypothetical protein